MEPPINTYAAQLLAARNVFICDTNAAETGFYQPGNVTYRQLFCELAFAFSCIIPSSDDIAFELPPPPFQASLLQPGSDLGIIMQHSSAEVLDSVVLAGEKYFIFHHDPQRCSSGFEHHPNNADCCLPFHLEANREFFIEPRLSFITRLQHDKPELVKEPRVVNKQLPTGLQPVPIIPRIFEEPFYPEIGAIESFRWKMKLPSLEELGLSVITCRQNTILLQPDERQSFEQYLWTIDPNSLTIRTMVPIECKRIVNGTSIYELIPEEEHRWLPPRNVIRWHFSQAVVRAYRAGGIEEPWDGVDEWSDDSDE